MAYFEWADDMVIDGGAIDDDHRKLVDLVNELHSATSQGKGQDVVSLLLERLIADTEEHLRREEHIMAQAGFPDLERHKVGHGHFINKLRELQARQAEGSITVAAQLSSVLRDWLSLHIRRNDKELKRFSQQQARDRERQRRTSGSALAGTGIAPSARTLLVKQS